MYTQIRVVLGKCQAGARQTRNEREAMGSSKGVPRSQSLCQLDRGSAYTEVHQHIAELYLISFSYSGRTRLTLRGDSTKASRGVSNMPLNGFMTTLTVFHARI